MISPADIFKARILIVDDQDAYVALIEQILHGAGYVAVASTTDPCAVCELYRTHRYDLIVLDLLMPGMNGFQVMEKLKEIETGGYLPVLAITGQPGNKLRALQAGAKDFVSKPFDPAEILMRVYNLLEVRLLHRDEVRLNLTRLENSQRIAGIGDWEYDFPNHRLVWSQEVYRILGIPQTDAPPNSETFYRQVHPDDLAFVHREKKNAAAGLRRVDFEHRLVRPDGEVRRIHQIVEMFFDDQGRQLRESGTIQDITERKLADDALLLSEARFRSLSESSPIGIFECDAAGRVTYYNPALIAMSGRPAKNSLGRSWDENVHPDDRASMSADWARAVTEGRNGHNEHRLLRPDGSVCWVRTLTAPGRDAEGRVTGFVGTVEDISERRRAEEALRESEERFSGAFEHAPIGVALVSPEGRWLKVNRAICDLVGYSEAELLTSTVQDLTYPEDLAVSVENIRRAIAGEVRSFQIEKRYVHRRGHIITALLSISLVRDAQGRPRYFISQIQDITERKQAEAALATAHEKLVDAARQAGMAEVATGVLHNVGNVLNSVTVASSCLAESLRRSKAANLSKVVVLLGEHAKDLGDFFTNDPKGKQVPVYLAQLAEHLAGEQEAALKELLELQKNIEHIKDIVNMQQNFATVTGSTETLPVAELVEDALRMNSGSFAQHDIQVTKEFKGTTMITGEKHKVLQILVNLVRNACDACKAADVSERKLSIRTASEKNHLSIIVCDNGVGVLPENLIRIFSHGFTTKKYGHGFGLHSAAIAAGEMGGSLTVHSDGPGRGATFTLELPCANNEDPSE